MTSAKTDKSKRKPYAQKACDVCRQKRVKCDETKPICGYCTSTGRETQCAWTGGTARKARTEAHFEALRKRVEALKAYADLLESMLDVCRREHGSTHEDGTSYLQFRPPVVEHAQFEDTDMQDDCHWSDDNDDITQELCYPTEKLKLREADLEFYGNTAPFRFITDVPRQPSRFPGIDKDPKSRYVLLVDGVEPTHYNPDFDWCRYLPSEVPLDRPEHDRVLDKLFKFFTSWCLRIVPSLFLRDMYSALSIPRSQTPPRLAHYSPMLHNSLLALATAFSDDPRIRDYRARLYFVNEAKRLLESECRTPNICAVHALSILASFYSSNGDHMLGYIYFGMSARVSQALGLSFDSSHWVKAGRISHDDMLDRNWANWTTFGQDACWSLYVGRDFAVPLPSQEIPVPFVDPEYDDIPWHYPPSNIPPQPNFLSATFAATCELLVITRRVMELVNTIRPSGNRHEIDDAYITKIDLQLHSWKEGLPPQIDITTSVLATSTPHRIMLHLGFWWTFILLHRPFFYRKQRPGQDIDHVKNCKRAAENIMELLAAWRKSYTLRCVPITLIQVVFAAGTVYLLLSVQASSGLRVAEQSLRDCLGKVDLCLQYLEEIGKSWKCATNIAGILRDLLNKQLKPSLERQLGRKNIVFPPPQVALLPQPTPGSSASEISDEPVVIQPYSMDTFDFDFSMAPPTSGHFVPAFDHEDPMAPFKLPPAPTNDPSGFEIYDWQFLNDAVGQGQDELPTGEINEADYLAVHKFFNEHFG